MCLHIRPLGAIQDQTKQGVVITSLGEYLMDNVRQLCDWALSCTCGVLCEKTANNRLPYRFSINMKSSADKGIQTLSLQRCNLRASTLTKEEVLSKSWSPLSSANSSSLRYSMVKGEILSMPCTREGRLMFPSLPFHDLFIIILRSWDVMHTSASSKKVFAIMCFCKIIILYGSVIPLAENSCNHADRSTSFPVLALP